MSFIHTLFVAIRALMRNKLRSFLTMLGVIIGVGSVVAMTAIGAGAKARIDKTFSQMGSNMLIVRSGSSKTFGVRGGAGSQPTLTWDDLRAIREEIPQVRLAAPLLAMTAQVMAEGRNWATGINGTIPDFFEIRTWPAERGTLFTDAEVRSGAKVAVIGKTVVENLFSTFEEPIGQTIRINNVPFEIIGIASEKGQTAFGRNNDDVVFVPMTTFTTKLQGGLQQYINGSIFVSVTSQSLMLTAQTRIEELLRARHKLRPGMPDDFEIRNLSDIASAQQEGAKTMTALLAGIALVSLIVGGIGIMNIMLVSVTERTREIGLRMAVGGKPRHILLQFMVEAITLSVVGGILGVLFGLGAAYYLVARFDWPMLVQPNVIALAITFSAIVGIGFGIYPAYKASRFDPIQALRYE